MPLKKGLDWFPLDTRLDEKFELIEAEFGMTGFAVVIKLFQRIYALNGYYCEWTKRVALLFSRSCGVGGNAVEEIVKASLRLGIFNREKYDAYGVLTSSGIQKRYLDAVVRRKEPQLREELRLVSLDEIRENVYILGEDADISPQRRVEKTRGDYRREEKKREEDQSRDDAAYAYVPSPSDEEIPIDLDAMMERYRKSLQKMNPTP